MKRVVMTLLLSLMVMSVSSFTYQTEYSYQKSAFGTTSSYIRYSNSQQAQQARTYQYNRIGYTTNVCRYNSSYGYVTTSKYSTTNPYTPMASSSGGRHGQPRRIVVYNGDGDSLHTPGPEDNPYWIYRFDGSRWWYSSDGGNTWNFWSDGFKFIFDIIKPGWYSSDGTWWGPGDPGSNAKEYYGYNPTPIGDNYIWFMVCMVSIYSLVKSKRNKLKHSAY